MKNSPAKTGKFEINREEMLILAKSECPDFRLIPNKYQYALALYACGATQEAICKLANMSEDDLADGIQRYEKHLLRMPDSAKTKLNRRLLWNAIGMYVGIVADRDKIQDMSPKDALVILDRLPAILDSMLALEKRITDADQPTFESFDSLKRHINDGKALEEHNGD